MGLLHGRAGRLTAQTGGFRPGQNGKGSGGVAGQSQSVLPVSAAGLKTVAVVGPSADSPSAYIGDYAPQPAYYTTAVSGARALLPHATVLTAPGCENIECGDDKMFGPAVAGAGKAGKGGMVVFVGGLNGTFNMAEGEGHDRDSVELLGQQLPLMKATAAAAQQAGSSFVVVLVGSAVAAGWAKEHADAVISAGYGGQEAGNAIWDVILGQYNPSGRLSTTWPRDDTQVRKLPSRPRSWVNFSL
jgi:hypothetical protein